MQRLMRLVVLGILLVSVAACQTLAGIESPEVHLAGVQVDSATLFEQHWTVTLDVRNPNDRDLTLKTIDYTLYINGKKFARGMTGSSVTLPAMGSARVDTQLTTSLLTSLGQLQSLSAASGKPLQYEVKGTARLGGFPLPVDFDHKGEFTLPAGPANIYQ